MKVSRQIFAGLVAGAVLAAAPGALAQQIETQHVRGNISVLIGPGGNIGVSVGDEGVFLIDDKFDQINPLIMDAVSALSDAPIRFVLNTHYHGDHTGGNQKMEEAGAVVFAHDNVHTRLVESSRPGETPPVLTFNDKVTLYLNGEEARVMYVANAHTDGDSIVWFKDSNVVHMGDTFFHELFPYIDVDGGGDVDGLVDAIAYVLGSMIDDETIVIPGHGAISNKAGLQAYYDMLVTSRDRVKAMKDGGASMEEVVAADPTAEFNEQWTWGFIDPETFVTSVYNSVD